MRLLAAFLPALLAAQTYEIVISRARVIDPESGLDAVRDIGVSNGKVAAISESALTGRRTIDARGLVAAPGFIDLHAHGQDLENQRLQAMDGVTTALELEIGTADVDAWYREREGKRLIHSGVTIGHVPSRMAIYHETSPTLVPSGKAAHQAATPEEITALRRRIETGLQQGALGIGFGIQYTPAATREEILDMFRAAARFPGAPAFIHIRTMGEGDRDAMTGLQEILANSAITGVPIHMVHSTSSGLRQARMIIDAITAAAARGIDITTECYPYTAAMTGIQSAIFDPGWQKVLGIGYGEVQWVDTGERLTEASFSKYRQQGGYVIMHMIPEEFARFAIAHPRVIIASDGVIHNGKGHPRGAGTFARMLGKYVRTDRAVTLPEAIRKMSLMPAQRLERYVPAMRDKGRIRPGADADVVVFNPDTVSDAATFENPALPSRGVMYLLVGGVTVVDNGKLSESRHPGQAIRISARR